MRSSARIDLDAITSNVQVLREHAPGAGLMAVVKADGYGHGLVPSARAAVAGGAAWLGVAFLEEALALRAAGLEVPVLAWLPTPGEDLAPAVAAGVDIGVYDVAALDRVVAAVDGVPARVQLKVDTGLSRGGATPADWPDLCAAAARREATGALTVTGVWSHVAFADGGP
ncbi:MAG: alanine racemase, partial [Pseudorhodobacter sp.]|nr:alanine racemase [Frankiaceae bacterium]